MSIEPGFVRRCLQSPVPCRHELRLTIRGVPDDVAARLEQLSRERGQSINTTVNQIIAGAVGMDERLRRLERYAVWSEDELEEFSGVLAQQRTVDDELWT